MSRMFPIVWLKYISDVPGWHHVSRSFFLVAHSIWQTLYCYESKIVLPFTEPAVWQANPTKTNLCHIVIFLTVRATECSLWKQSKCALPHRGKQNLHKLVLQGKSTLLRLVNKSSDRDSSYSLTTLCPLYAYARSCATGWLKDKQ